MESTERPSRTFRLLRKRDVSGTSGTGYVAEGVEFHDGQCVLSWFGKYHTLGIYPNAEQLMAIHGHGGATILEWHQESNGTERR